MRAVECLILHQCYLYILVHKYGFPYLLFTCRYLCASKLKLLNRKRLVGPSAFRMAMSVVTLGSSTLNCNFIR